MEYRSTSTVLYILFGTTYRAVYHRVEKAHREKACGTNLRKIRFLYCGNEISDFTKSSKHFLLCQIFVF